MSFRSSVNGAPQARRWWEGEELGTETSSSPDYYQSLPSLDQSAALAEPLDELESFPVSALDEPASDEPAASLWFEGDPSSSSSSSYPPAASSLQQGPGSSSSSSFEQTTELMNPDQFLAEYGQSSHLGAPPQLFVGGQDIVPSASFGQQQQYFGEPEPETEPDFDVGAAEAPYSEEAEPSSSSSQIEPSALSASALDEAALAQDLLSAWASAQTRLDEQGYSPSEKREILRDIITRARRGIQGAQGAITYLQTMAASSSSSSSSSSSLAFYF